jgi:3-hydroxyisobutyrate dehydrogenase-like beta-hydroxyacid dehydrogenase
MSTISILGLGSMGTALAEALLQRGHDVVVWNRTPEKAARLRDRGAVIAGSPRAAVAASELVIVCVLDGEAVTRVLASASEALPGKSIVNLTTGSPDEARALARSTEAHGARYLGGAVMAVPAMIGSPHALLLYSGPRDVFDEHAATLAALGASRHLGADPGMAALQDFALLSGMCGLFAGFLHAAALVGTGGVKATEFLALLIPWLQAMIGQLPGLAAKIDSGEHDRDVQSNLVMQTVALQTIVAASRAQGVRPDLLEPMLRLMQQRTADGHGGDDLSGIVELLRTR